MNIAHAIKLCRAAKNFSIEEVSKESCLSKSYISMIENSKRKPSMEAIEKISETLGIPVVVLLMLAAEKGEISTLSPDLVSELQKSVLDVLITAASDATSKLRDIKQACEESKRGG